MRTVSVPTARPYDVHIGEGLLARAGELCSAVLRPCKAAIITDDTVAGLYLQAIEDSLRRGGYTPVAFQFAHGERSKNIGTLEAILEFLAGQQLTRSDVVVALGGGVVGDAAGFAAAVYLRGIKLIQIPTTLLAQVDSSVGGKTAVDLRAGKNLAGAFCQPDLVLCDIAALRTLEPAQFSAGMAEVIKDAAIFDRALFDSVSGGRHDLISTVERCVQLKRDVVARDEFDRGERQLLNFGHTAGHGIERLSGYTMLHGEAVGVGMVICARASYRLGLSKEDCAPPILAALRRYGLPTGCGYTAAEIAGACLTDKKRRGGTITLVIPERLGHCVLRDFPVADLENFIAEGMRE